MRPPRSHAAPALLAVLLAAGCGGGSDGGGGTASGTGGGGAAKQPGGSSKSSQGSPAEVVVAFYEAIRDGQFEKACGLLHPSAQSLFVQTGKSCPGEVADDFDAEDRAEFGEVAVRENLIEMNGDVAEVPAKAIYNTDRPAPFDPPPSYNPDLDQTIDESPETPFESTKTVRTGGLWWIDPEFSGG